MINADEHARLLSQVAQLERDSRNFFDVEKEFFLITSENLSEVTTRLYGYAIQSTGIYEQDNLTETAAANLDGRGCYVYVEARDGQITIKQDLSGCWGLYLFRSGDYFALSNSFFRLLDHVKYRYPLSVNRDYCHYLMVKSDISVPYLETAVNEIQALERNAIVLIDATTKSLELELIDYREQSVSLDTAEGFATLDRWIELWSNILRGVAQHTKFIAADLSGGFDTRVLLLPLLHSGIDLNDIRIYSIKSNLHTYKDDYAIASQIAEHYGFKLNQPLPTRQAINYSLTDAWNADLYHQQTFRNLPTIYSTQKTVDKTYYLKGLGGETIRDYWHMTPSTFIEQQRQRVNNYPRTLARELSHAIETILQAGFRYVRDKYKITEEDSADIPRLFYVERYRNHHGKEALGHYLKNIIDLSPVLDPAIRTLKLATTECPDTRLLIAMIFTRYAPDLLNFPFDSKRSIAPETIEYARKLNERFPRHATTFKQGEFNLQPRDTQAEQIISSGRNNPNIPGGLPQACLKATFESSKTYGLFTSYFDEAFYQRAATSYDTRNFGYDRPIHAIVGVTRVLEDVAISQRNHSPYRDMQRYLEQDFATINNAEQILTKLEPYLTARIDVKLATEGDFQILNVSDDKAKVTRPTWFQKDGIGYQIQSYVGKLSFVAKAAVDGRINFYLRGLDIRRPDDRSKRIIYWIDYTRLVINGKTLFDTLTPVWHDKPYSYNLNVKAGEEVQVQVEWLPHRSDT